MDGTPYVCMYASKGPRNKITPGASPAQATAKRQPSPPEGERPCKFKICVTKKQAPVPRVPKVSQLIAAATTVPPPEAVLRKLGGATIVVGVDIETADWVDRKKSTSKGQFGFFNFCHPDHLMQKIVQIGWAMGEVSEGAPLLEYQELLVQPEGFVIAERATALHGITQEAALSRGRPLRDVLCDFMDMVERAEARGARLVVHHLEFDAGNIDRQLSDAGLVHKRAQWAAFARKGFCTMDPDVCAWAQRCMGRDLASDDNSALVLTLSLKAAANLLLPKSDLIKDLQKNNHTAGADAQLHRLLYIALRSLAQANQLAG